LPDAKNSGATKQPDLAHPVLSKWQRAFLHIVIVADARGLLLPLTPPHSSPCAEPESIIPEIT
jgi:hypothetical protein